MKISSFIAPLLLVFSFGLNAQKNVPTDGTAHYLDQWPTERMTSINALNSFSDESELLQALDAQFDLDGSVSFSVDYRRESPGGKHINWQRHWNGRRLYRGEIKCNLTHDGQLWSAYTLPVSLVELDEQAIPEIQIPTQLLQLQPNSKEDVWFPGNGGLLEAERLWFNDPSKHLNTEVIVNKSGKPIYYQDLVSYHSHFNPTDTAIEVTVFNPDPLTTAQTTYGGLFTDQNDNDISAINNQREFKMTRATFDNGTFYLENDYVVVDDFEAPLSVPVTQNNPDFHYTRSQQGFEDVMVLYHLTDYQLYLQFLGFNIMRSQIAVDPHAFNGADNSYFSPGTGLGFGEGGVDDAEDADVIIHEYGHALSYDAAPGSNTGTERRTLDEALSDYLAASYSHSINPYRWQRVYTWDGHNEFWPGRMVTSTKNYQNISFGFSIYEHTDLWSASLMDILMAEGREVMDRALIQSLYAQAPNMTFEQAALEVLQADTLLYWGIHAMSMYNIFDSYGILNIPDIGVNDEEGLQWDIRNTSGFAEGLELNIEGPSGFSYMLTDGVGKLIRQGTSEDGSLALSGEPLSSGAYFLVLFSKDGKNVRKLRLLRY